MTNNRKNQFKKIETSAEEIGERIKEHHLRVFKGMLMGLVGVVALVGVMSVYFMLKTYTDYTVIKKVERQDTLDTRFAEFNGNILKYSNDGAFYTDIYNHLIWNQTYEMNDPMIDICEDYVAIASGKGTHIYILNQDGLKGEIETAVPIRQIEVGNQGTVAVLMGQDGNSYIKLYSKEGKELAQGELHLENSGYPLSMSISNDCKKMAVSLVDVEHGAVDTTIKFYNFGSVGQNEIDNEVKKYSYQDTLIPEIEFIDNDYMIAFGDKKAIIYEGIQKPVEKKVIKFPAEIKNVFYSNSYFGFIYSGKNKENKEVEKLEVYEKKGTRVLNKEFSMNYTKVEIINDREVVIIGDMDCMVYNMKGVMKFQGKTKKPILKIQKGETSRSYILILEGETQRIRLK
ncbi:MAG: DUF5711 family protein [Lachnospiraceae bacterium]